MKVVILAGGLGTRISEETHIKPKPMIEIGGRPLIWHIMKLYSSHNFNEFIICCGYKGYVIKEYFVNYFNHMSDITINMELNKIIVHQKNVEPWTVTLVDTGEKTQTAGRLKRVKQYLKNEKNFCFTYGDGLSNVNITELVKFHYEHTKIATVTAVRPPGRYGALEIHDSFVSNFVEKPLGDGGYINGGFFVLSNKSLDIIKDDSDSWESDILIDLVKNKQLVAYKHDGFWQPMDTLREKNLLEQLWESGNAPWKNW